MNCVLFQQNFHHMAAWCVSWQSKLNFFKCSSVRFGLAFKLVFNYKLLGSQLVMSLLAKDLGVLFDSQLLFSDHRNSIVNEAYVHANMLFKYFHFCDSILQMKLYNSLARPILENSIALFGFLILSKTSVPLNVCKYFSPRV